MSAHETGFSLIEVMITVAIVGVLASIAYPSYTDSVRKGRRAEAITMLYQVQLAQEKWRANNSSYGYIAPCSTPKAGCFQVQAAAATGTITTEGGYYNLANIGTPSSTAFSAKADAQGKQADDKASGVACATLTIAQSGPDYGTGSPNQAACWGKS